MKNIITKRFCLLLVLSFQLCLSYGATVRMTPYGLYGDDKNFSYGTSFKGQKLNDDILVDFSNVGYSPTNYMSSYPSAHFIMNLGYMKFYSNNPNVVITNVQFTTMGSPDWSTMISTGSGSGGIDTMTSAYWHGSENVVEFSGGDYIRITRVEITYNINVPVTSVTISCPQEKFYLNREYTFTAKVAPSNATNSNVVWSLEQQEEIAEIVSAQDNVVTVMGKAPGTATLIACSEENSDVYGIYRIEMTEGDVQSIILSSQNISMYVGDKIDIEASIFPADAPEKNITWTYSNEGIVSITPGGDANHYVVEALKLGTTTLTARCGSVSATCEVTVSSGYHGFEQFMQAGEGIEGTIDGPITAVYKNGSYLYVVDSKNYPMMVYGEISETLKNGDTIENITGTYELYKGCPELTNPTLGKVTSGGSPVSPLEMTSAPTKADINRYVVFENAVLVSSTKMEFAGSTVTLYKKYRDVTFPTQYMANYRIEGIVDIYNDVLQFCPIYFEEITDNSRVVYPVISCDNNIVTIECTTEGAEIYYTVNGKEPTENSLQYFGPFEISETVTVKAIAVKEGMNNSLVSSMICEYVNPYAGDVTFDFTDPTLYGFSTDNVTNNEIRLTDQTLRVGVISMLNEMTATTGTHPRFYLSGNSWTYRFYQYNVITISADEGYRITKIAFNASKLGNSSITFSPGTFSNNVWTPDSSGVTKTMANETTVGEKAVTITKSETGNNPTISSMTVYYVSEEPQSGLEDVSVDESEAVYYNLQGVRVANPHKGIYIKVLGNKATKVAL